MNYCGRSEIGLRPYPFVYVYLAKVREVWEAPGNEVWKWIIEWFTAPDMEPLIMDITPVKPSLDELRSDFECPAFMDESE